MTPLVLVHGFMGGGAQWTGQSDLGHERPLVCLDLPGFGAHAHLPPIDSIRGFADWALAELTREGIERFHLLGHSMGGMVVQEMAHIAPERIDRLILYGTGPEGVLPGRFEPIETSIARAQSDGAGPTARRIAANWFLQGADAPAYPACAAIAEQCTLDAMLAGLRAMPGWSGADRLAAIASPTLVLWGESDSSYPWAQIETLWQTIPRSHLCVLPFCAHAAHAEDPQSFNLAVDRFLRHPQI